MYRILVIVFFGSCLHGFTQERLNVDYEILEYMQAKSMDDTASVAVGTVGNGSLEHGKLVPYKGENFMYFDRESYLKGRAFLHGSVLNALLETYDSLGMVLPHRYFNIMECANENGGELFPHRTHQNGMSIDLMMPLVKHDKPYYGLDTLGASHYALDFNDDGKYLSDPSVEIDFDLVARQLLIMDAFAEQYGLYISKVIIKIELKDELFATPHGKLLEEKDIYVVQGLSPLINALHDDHFHVDFGFKLIQTNPAENTKSSNSISRG